MAKNCIQEMLGKNERILLVTRQHWFVLFSNILLEIILTLVLIAAVIALTILYPLAALGFVLVLVPLAGMVRDILVWYNREYIVTNRRVIQISGVLNKKRRGFLARKSKRRKNEPVLLWEAVRLW